MADISKVYIDSTPYNVKDATARSGLNSKMNSSLKGAANGVAELDANGKVPAAQMPSITAQTTSIGSASAGTAIAADDITSWSAGSITSISQSEGVLIITNGTTPTLQYTEKSIPNISVTATTVATGVSIS